MSDAEEPGRDGASPGNAGEIYERSGIGHCVGFGSRPGLVIVDLQNGFTDPSCIVGGALNDVVAATMAAASWGLRTIVPEECIGDRAAGPHASNVFDINAKYADVVPLAQTLEQIQARAASPAPTVSA